MLSFLESEFSTRSSPVKYWQQAGYLIGARHNVILVVILRNNTLKFQKIQHSTASTLSAASLKAFPFGLALPLEFNEEEGGHLAMFSVLECTFASALDLTLDRADDIHLPDG